MLLNREITSAMRKTLGVGISAVLFGLIALFNPKPLYAQYFSGIKSVAMGGAGRAAGESEGHILNPASLAHVKGYNIDGLYRYQSFDDGSGIRDWGINLADGGSETLFRGGFAYINSDRKLNGVITTDEDYILSFGGLVIQRLSLGMQAQRWVRTPPSNSEQVIYQGSAGLIYTPVEEFGIGLVTYNFLEDHEPELRPELALGFHYLYEPVFRVRLDVAYPTKYNSDKKGIIMVGTETLFISGFKPRLGAKFDDVAKKAILSFGLGWDGPKFAVNYAFEKDVRTKDEIRQSFDLNLLF